MARSDRRRTEYRTNPTTNALVAAATLLTRDSPNLRTAMVTEQWQDAAWGFFDTVGELRFGAAWIANVLSKVRLVAATAPESPGDPPALLTEGPAADLVGGLAGGIVGQSQMMGAFGVLLTIAGLGYLVGETDPETGVQKWGVYSGDDLRSSGSGIQRQAEDNQWEELPEDALVVKVWRPHPRRRWLADAPTRSVMSPLRQIELLDARIDADGTSRLAGAGLLIMPNEAVFPKANPDDPEDSFVPLLIESMTVPIGNRQSAAAVVPLVVRLPAQYADAVRHITTSTAFDERVMELRDSAIRRLALGLDIPPEVVLGVGDSNHWSAWAIKEEAITLHAEPLAECVCAALTIGYLRPALEAQGLEAQSAMVWYDTSGLRVPPDKGDDALQLHDRLIISNEALLRETGFDQADAPDEAEFKQRLATKVIMGAPTLVEALGPLAGLDVDPALFAQAEAPPPAPAPAEPGGPGTPERGAPAPSERVPEPVAAAGLFVAGDLLVTRALERAGARLRGAAIKANRLTASGAECDNVNLHACLGSDVTAVTDLDALLAGAWTYAGSAAVSLGVDPDPFVSALDRYTRALLSTGTPHDADRLAAALGDPAPV